MITGLMWTFSYMIFYEKSCQYSRSVDTHLKRLDFFFKCSFMLK